jgi:hypothetical protein
VRPGAACYQAGLQPEQRDSFTNLLLLCLPHHEEVDDEQTGEQLYPPEVLRRWKIEHEGSSGPALAALGPIDPDLLTALLTAVFTPPLDRLDTITKRLEETGTANAQTVVELKQVLAVLSVTGRRYRRPNSASPLVRSRGIRNKYLPKICPASRSCSRGIARSCEANSRSS